MELIGLKIPIMGGHHHKTSLLCQSMGVPTSDIYCSISLPHDITENTDCDVHTDGSVMLVRQQYFPSQWIPNSHVTNSFTHDTGKARHLVSESLHKIFLKIRTHGYFKTGQSYYKSL